MMELELRNSSGSGLLAAMLGIQQFMDIQALHKEGLSIRAIAQKTGYSRNTVRKVLREKSPKTYERQPRPSILDPYKAYLKERFEAYGLSAVCLHGEIVNMGYSGSPVTVRRYLQTLKAPKIARQRATVRFETPPGKQAQVDWAECGTFTKPDGTRQTIYAFVMVLGYSRFMHVEFTTSMKLPVLIECHQRAFTQFGGCPQTILYDNMKQVRLAPNKWNETFLDFAHHYGFAPKTHRPYRPRTKGKVERMVDYLKDNFLKGREFDLLQDFQLRSLLSRISAVKDVFRSNSLGVVSLVSSKCTTLTVL